MNKKLWLLFIIMLIITISSIKGTFALFETNATSSSDLSVGKWKIMLNGDDVSFKENISLDNFVYADNAHVESGYFAPGVDATFDIVIDARYSDVSVIYEFTIDDSDLEEHPNITYSITNLNNNEVIESNSYTNKILLSDASRITTLRFSLSWDDIEDYDSNDTELINGEIALSIDANFKQYIE